MSNDKTCITISTKQCKEACIKAIAFYEKQAAKAREMEIEKVLARKPKRFLFWTDRSGCASTREEAIKIIKEETPFSTSDWLYEIDIQEVKGLKNLCDFADEITLADKHVHLIRHWLPKRNEQ